MKESLPFIIGIAAGALTTLAFLPQVIKIYVSKSARDVSIMTFSLFFTGIALWLVYGVMIKEAPIIIANAISIVLAFMIVVMKLVYDKKK